MITCSQINYDRMGNGLFRLATTISLAIDNNDQYEFPKWIYADYFPKLNCWNNNIDWNKFSIYRDPEFIYNKIPYSNFLDIQGYFQSEKYFRHNIDEIIRLFRLSYLSFDICGIHIRRGDYLVFPNLLPILSLDYYQKAIDYAINNWTVKKFIVFTDDREWVKSNFIPYFNNLDIICSNNKNDIDDFIQLSECNYIITANSTFSVWAGILANHDRVISPNNWFHKDSGISSKDIIPDRWTKI